MPSLTYNNQFISYSDQTKTLLEVLEQSEIKVNSQCRNGICGACRCKLIKGEAIYKSSPLAMIKEGEILLCLAQSMYHIEIQSI
ncbi:class I ribonucleotide reductase maintenance protein YfaE [Thiotrichales bacterium 19S3-7]|nr:class I ribonucleotide reductase maintenance protein YfaE [Thiotrichales bacterium 19S3-7]MCF6800765.1 class I ribonucleotide reductase maintenance protein YfaE [Thiotrichales bacterium 19S3-11]